MKKNQHEISVAYGLLMCGIVSGASQTVFDRAPFWEHLFASLKNSSSAEILGVLGFFIGIGYLFTYIIFIHTESAFKISKRYGRATNMVVAIIYIIFFTEALDVYFVAIRESSKFASMLMSSLFFSPILILCINLIQRLVLYIINEEEVASTSSNEFLNENQKNLVRLLAKEEFEKFIQYSLTRVYDKDSEIGHEWTQKVSDGHWATSVYDEKTKKFTVRHLRTNENIEKNDFNARALEEFGYNKDVVFGHNDDGIVSEKMKKEGSIYVPFEMK